MDHGAAGPHRDPLDERLDEGLGFGEFAGAQELAHLLGEAGDDFGAVEQLSAFAEHPARLVGGAFELFLALLVLADAVAGIVDREVGHLQQVPDPVEAVFDLGQLLLDRRQLGALLVGHAVHLLVDQLDQFADVAPGQDMLAELVDDQLLEPLGAQPGSLAGLGALLDLRLADVVAVLAALGLGRGERFAAGLAGDQTGEQVAAGDPPRVGAGGTARLHHPPDALELCGRDDRGEGVLDPNRRGAVLGVETPDERAGVGLVGQQPVHGGLEPGLAGRRGDAVRVERTGDVEHALAGEGGVEDAAHEGVLGRVELEPGAGLAAVGDVDLAVAVGRPGGDPEAARSGLAHAAGDLLSEIVRVELVDRLNDRLHQLAGRGVVGMLRDRGDADAAPSEHRFEGDGVFALAGEAGELPDQDLLEGGVLLLGLVQHLAELGAVGDPSRLGLVDELAHDPEAVALGVIAQGAQLCGDREIDVLAVRGDAGVERRRGRVEWFWHRSVPSI